MPLGATLARCLHDLVCSSRGLELCGLLILHLRGRDGEVQLGGLSPGDGFPVRLLACLLNGGVPRNEGGWYAKAACP